jgi:hypothetical protein
MNKKITIKESPDYNQYLYIFLPEFTINRKEKDWFDDSDIKRTLIALDTGINIVRSEDFLTISIKVLGFGVGYSWQEF